MRVPTELRFPTRSAAAARGLAYATAALSALVAIFGPAVQPSTARAQGEPGAAREAGPSEAAEAPPSPSPKGATEPSPVGVVVAAIEGAGREDAPVEPVATAVLDQLGPRLRGRPVTRLPATTFDGCEASGAHATPEGSGRGDGDTQAGCFATALSRAGAAASYVVKIGPAPDADEPSRTLRFALVEADGSTNRTDALVVPDSVIEGGAGAPAPGLEERLDGPLSALAPSLPAPPPRTTLLLAVNVPGADLSVDGEAVGQAPIAPLEVEPGTHTVTAQAEGFKPFEGKVDVEPGQAARLDVDLRPDATTLAQLEQEDRSRSSKAWWKRWPVWAGVGGAVLIGVVTGVAIAASGDDAQDPDGFPIGPIEP
jgi:hypothetical protein